MIECRCGGTHASLLPYRVGNRYGPSFQTHPSHSIHTASPHIHQLLQHAQVTLSVKERAISLVEGTPGAALYANEPFYQPNTRYQGLPKCASRLNRIACIPLPPLSLSLPCLTMALSACPLILYLNAPLLISVILIMEMPPSHLGSLQVHAG